jgi:hypothetical protein
VGARVVVTLERVLLRLAQALAGGHSPGQQPATCAEGEEGNDHQKLSGHKRLSFMCHAMHARQDWKAEVRILQASGDRVKEPAATTHKHREQDWRFTQCPVIASTNIA